MKGKGMLARELDYRDLKRIAELCEKVGRASKNYYANIDYSGKIGAMYVNVYRKGNRADIRSYSQSWLLNHGLSIQQDRERLIDCERYLEGLIYKNK